MTDPDGRSSLPPLDPPSPARRKKRTWRDMAGVLWTFAGAAILLGLSLVWMIPLPPGMNPYNWMQWLLGNSSEERWPGFVGLVSGIVSYGLLSVPRSLASVLPMVLGLLFLAALSGSFTVHRRRAAALVLGHLSSAIQLNLPLPTYLRSAARGEALMPRRRLLRLAGDLDAGDSVASALAGAAGELPPLTLDRIAAAEQSFALGPALGEILERERRRTVDTTPGVPGRAYAAVVLTTMVLITWMLLIFVMPKFAQIFAGFKMKLPPVTLLLIGNFPEVMSTLLGVVLVVVVLVQLSRVTRGLFTSHPAPRLFRWISDPIAWHAPVYGRLTQNRQMALVCEALAEALIAGRPLPEAIGIATLPSLNGVLKRRLQTWRSLVEAGGPVARSARAARVPTLLCDLLAGTAADDGSGAVSATVFAGRAYAGASGRVAAVIDAVSPVLITGVLAVFVAFLALAMFMPMITLIDGMTGGATTDGMTDGPSRSGLVTGGRGNAR